MTTGRTVAKHTRVYIDGYDMSGYARAVGPLMQSYDEVDLTVFTDAIKGILPAHATLGIGTLNGVMDNTATSGLHVVMNAPGTIRTVMIPVGMNATPAQGDPVYTGQFEQQGYYAEGDPAYVSIPFGTTSEAASTLLYDKPWGWLLHAKGAEIGANSATGIDDNAAATAKGGYMCYQVFSGDGTATIKVQDAAVNADGSFADLSGATTGSIDCSSVKYGIVAIGRTATVRRYLRWQVALGTASTVTFALAFVRALF